jgi:hypothetical protein
MPSVSRIESGDSASGKRSLDADASRAALEQAVGARSKRQTEPEPSLDGGELAGGNAEHPIVCLARVGSSRWIGWDTRRAHGGGKHQTTEYDWESGDHKECVYPQRPCTSTTDDTTTNGEHTEHLCGSICW